MEKILETIRDSLKERINSPIFFSFILSWIFINWKIVVLLFGIDENLTPRERITFIENNYINSTYNFNLPLLSSLFYTVFYPLLSGLVTILWSKIDYEKNKFVNQIYRKKLLTIEESIELREKLESINDEVIKITKSKEEEIKNLKDRISDLIEKNQPRTKIENTKSKINKDPDEQKIREEMEKLYIKFPNKSKEIEQIFFSVSNNLLMNVEKNDMKIVTYLTLNNILETIDRQHRFTPFGKKFAAKYSEKFLT